MAWQQGIEFKSRGPARFDMSKGSLLAQRIWLVQIETVGGGFYTLLPKNLALGIKVASLGAALKSLNSGEKPALIFLEGQPGKMTQNAMSKINEHEPSIPVLIISRWQNASDMRSWFSRYFTEIANMSATIDEERPNTYQLSTRELDILRLMVKGLIKKEIAEQLSISYHTVDNHERNIFRKMNIHNRSAAVAKALIEKIC
jgi:DNA-binding CsgD family transcriptional regulator